MKKFTDEELRKIKERNAHLGIILTNAANALRRGDHDTAMEEVQEARRIHSEELHIKKMADTIESIGKSIYLKRPSYRR